MTATAPYLGLGLRNRQPVSARTPAPDVGERFGRMRGNAEARLAEPFKGITTDGIVVPNLFPLEATGISTEPIRRAALQFLGALSDEQRQHATFDLTSDAWRRWWNIHPFLMRHGVLLEDLADNQREAGLRLLEHTLSASGFQTARDIMRLNHTVGEITGSWPISVAGPHGLDLDPDRGLAFVACDVLSAFVRDFDWIVSNPPYIAAAEGVWKQLTADQARVKMTRVRARLWGNALQTVGLRDTELAERSAANYHRYRQRYFSLYPGALNLLRDLKAKGKRLGLLTNGVSETHREKIALLQITEYFDAIFLYDEVGMVKPDPLLFAHACRTLGGAPAHGAMVGDRYDRDIRGALEAGLYAIWLNVRGEELPPGATPPDATCSSIAQVARILLAPAGVS